MQKELKHTINLHPSYFGPQTAEYILNKLHADVEGTCSGRLGYIIAVLGVSPTLSSTSRMPHSASESDEFSARERAD